MEAAPRLPMLFFDLKVCTENTQFAPQLKQYITAFYNEDPDSYLTEIHNLESLRAGAVRPSTDVAGVQLLKKYYCQLHFLKSRFPMEENQDAAVTFAWKDPQLDISYSSNDIRFELMVIMYNIGALHTFLGAHDSRSNPEGMKLACTHFQCAAWAFQAVKEKYHQFVMYISLLELVHFFQQVCLAQAQECILEKSMLDNRKATIIAKVAVQVHAFYRQSLTLLEACNEELFRDKTYKEWTKFLQFKISYFKCIALLFQGQQAEEQQKMGERVAFYQAACDQLEEARKWASTLKQKHSEIQEGLAFTQDVVEGKRKAAKNENEFIYHEEVPTKENLQEVKGAILVKGISFSINDMEVSGPDIFARLVPMEAHEAASLYSEKKAQMLRNIGELIESKDQSLAEFMSSMQLDVLTKMHQATGIPQEIIDRAAALSAKPSATQDLIDSMGKLSNIYQEVESSLKEIETLLKEEEEAEKGYQEIMGKRPPSIIATDLSREAAKYKEAHMKANESNQTLHRAMTAHVANLKILQQPLRQLQQQLPTVELPNRHIDEKALKDLDTLVAKVEEMRNQRAMLWAQLRESVHNDDITNSLVTKQPNQSLEQLFQQEMQKHQQLTTLIEQNAAAQENIKKALVDAYAQAVNTRRYVQDIIQKRSSTVSALISSYDSYDDLLAKANKGIEFYTKLETNVSKLLQRIKSACKVQQEEREQMLIKNDVPKVDEGTAAPAAPKLKDYLDSRKKNINPSAFSDPNMQYQPQHINYAINPSMDLPPGVRPAPLGSEVTDIPKSTNVEPALNYINPQYNYGQAQMYQHPVTGNISSVDQELANRMNTLLSGSKMENMGSPYNPQYSYSNYIPQNYTPTSYQFSTQNFPTISQNDNTSLDANKAYTTTINSYRTLTSTSTLPSNTNSHIQYPDSNVSQVTPSDQSYQYPNYSNASTLQPTQSISQANNYNANSYYPTGYSPNYSTGVSSTNQNFSDVQYHSVEYATSVQPNTQQKNFYSPTYSSPIPNLTSASSKDTAFNPAYPYASTAEYTSMTNAYPTNTVSYSSQSQNYPSYPSNSTQPVSTFSTGTTSSVSSSIPYADNYNYQASTPYSNGSTFPNMNASGYPSNQYSQDSSYSSGVASYANYTTGIVSSETQQPTANLQSYYGSYPVSSDNTVPQQSSNIQNAYGATSPTQNIYGTYPVSSDNTLPQQSNSIQNAYGTAIPATQTVYGTYPVADTSVSQQTSSTQNVSYGTSTNQTRQDTNTYGTYPSANSTPVPEQQSIQNVGYDYSGYYSQNYGQSYQVGYNYNASDAGQQIPQAATATTVTTTTVATTKESNVDLLSGLDFTINQAPLVPQQNIPSKPLEEEIKPTPAESSKSNVTKQPSVTKEEPPAPEIKRPLIKLLPSKPLNNSDVKKLFNSEVEKYEKYLETLTNKTLSGPTNLDIKWKEIQDKQESDSQKKIISVARCYPMKNRYPDILPYDHSRIELCGTKDDYINASLIKDVSPYAPAFIVTQSPLPSTFGDFWTMIKEQQVELIFSLLSDTEIGDDVYWPKEKGQTLNFLNMVITLQSILVKPYWVERLISVNVPEKRESWMVMHLQFTSWPGSLFPTSPDPFVSYILELVTLHQQQRCNTHPVAIHCSSGIGRSGLVCLLTTAIYDVTNITNSIPDLAAITSKLTNCRKNILRDREHLKFAYECFLAYMKQVVNQDKMTKTLNEVVPKIESSTEHPVEVVEKPVDPLNTLDPFWASKK